MKHLLNGVAIAAALAIAAPAWAQAPMTPSSPPKAAPAVAAPAAPMASKQRHKRAVHRASRRGGKMARMAPGDAMTEQLNREELARLQGGGGPPPPPAMQGPRPSGR
jgi:hypothetical protein